MALIPGTRLGVYEVVAQIGAGGMGEVYRARDTKLSRDVALKILPDVFAKDPDRLARFRREAQVLAALNHPNIGHIYGLEDRGGCVALVLELVEGPTLADRIRQGPIALNDALPIARQIAEALEAAHDLGIVHRDLKPANIKVRPDGTAKVLDFGLAKAVDPVVPSGADDMETATVTSPALTAMGTILGTAAYMSPEQARGLPVDRRTDNWAFGCVLYEMLTGRRAFEGKLVSDVLASVLKTEPNWQLVPAGTPAAVGSLIRRCLEKDPRRRLQAIGDARVALEDLLAGGAESSRPPEVPRRVARGRRLATAGSMLALGTAIGGGAVWIATRPVPPRASRTSIVATGPATPTISVDGEDLAIAPDGSRVVYVGNNGTQLFVRALDALEPVPIATGVPSAPFVSPDGRWVGFIDNNSTLKRVAITGGPPITITTLESPANAAAWAPDDTILFAMPAKGTGLLRIPVAGGAVETLTQPDRAGGETDHAFPQILPGGREVLFTITRTSGSEIAVRDLRSGSQRTVLRGGSHAYYVPGGYLVYAAGGTLLAVPFDLGRLETRGTPVPVVPRLLAARGIRPRDFAVATDGTLIYVEGGSVAGTRTLVWVDRAGQEDPIPAPPRAYVYPRVSPDGTRLAVSIADQDNDVWIWDLRQATLAPITFDPAQDSNPVWTPDGRRVIFASNRNGGVFTLWSQAADGTGVAEQLTHGGNQLPTGITADGKHVLFNQNSPSGRDVMVLVLDGPRRVTPLVQTPFEDRNGEVSPTGRWLAYESNSSGRFEVYLRPFPLVDDGKWQVSTTGGTRPMWARNREELFFMNLDGALVSVHFGESGPGPQAARRDAAPDRSAPVKLFEGRYFTGGISPTYDVSPDGKRFLMIKESTGATAVSAGIVVVQHFDEQVKHLVAAGR